MLVATHDSALGLSVRYPIDICFFSLAIAILFSVAPNESIGVVPNFCHVALLYSISLPNHFDLK